MPRGRALVAALVGFLAARGLGAQSATDEAAAAYEQGERAFANGDFGAAADYFETADHTVPAPQSLIQAIRAHRGAHTPAHDARAASLALALLRRPNPDPRITAYANRIVDELQSQLARVTVRCDGCDLSMDARGSASDVFVEPGPHVLSAAWGMRVQRRELDLAAGSNNAFDLSPPAVEPATPTPTARPAANGPSFVDTELPPAMRGAAPTAERPPTPPAPVQAPASGLSPALFVTGAVVTAGLGGTLVWSGLDTLDGNTAYTRTPTQAGLDDGRSREMRTNVLVGVTAGTGVATVVLGIFTRWHPRSVTVSVGPSGASVGGRF